MITRCLLPVFLAASLAAPAEPAATRSLSAAYFNLAGAADGEKVQTAVASIDAAPGLDCRLVDKPPVRSWREVPADADPAGWLSLVKVKFGQQCDFLLFRFSDRAGTLAYAGRRPSRVREVKYYYSVPPGPDQIPENAIRETATDFVFRRADAEARTRPLLGLRIEPWPESAVPGGEAGGASLRAEVLEAMAFAAAYEAGWRPTAGPAGTGLALSGREEMGILISLRAAGPDGKEAWRRDRIPREDFFNHLVRLFFRLREKESVVESLAFAPREAALEGCRDGRLFLRRVAELLTVNPAGGRLEIVASNALASASAGFKVEGARVAALDAAGSERWSFDAGEPLAAPPSEAAGRVLVASRNNRLYSLDAGTGAVRAETVWPTWILGAAAAPSAGGGLAAVTDLRRRLVLLRLTDLKPVRETVFPWEWRGPVFFGRVPAAWSLPADAEDGELVTELATDAVALLPAFLVQDRDGFVHAAALPE